MQRAIPESLSEGGHLTHGITTRGFREGETRLVGNLVADVLDSPQNAAILSRVKACAVALTREFPVFLPRPLINLEI